MWGRHHCESVKNQTFPNEKPDQTSKKQKSRKWINEWLKGFHKWKMELLRWMIDFQKLVFDCFNHSTFHFSNDSCFWFFIFDFWNLNYEYLSRFKDQKSKKKNDETENQKRIQTWQMKKWKKIGQLVALNLQNLRLTDMKITCFKSNQYLSGIFWDILVIARRSAGPDFD